MATVSRTTLVLGTGASAFGVDQLTPTINWLLDGCKTARPESTAALIAALLIIAGTAIFHAIQAAAQTPPGQPVLQPDPAADAASHAQGGQ